MRNFICTLAVLVGTFLPLHTRIVQHPHAPTIFYKTETFAIDPCDRQTLSQQRFLIGCDLNGVVFLKDYTTLLSHSLSLQYELFKAFLHKNYLWLFNNPDSLVWDRYLDFCDYTTHTNQEREVVKNLRYMIQKLNILNFPVIDLIWHLEQRGHYVAALSNTGSRLIALQVKLLNEHYESASTEQQGSISTVLALLTKPQSVFAGPETDWSQKPQPHLYEYFCRLHKDHSGLRLFIDDHEENVRASLEFFDIGILCINPQQLKADLQALELL